VAHTTTGKKPTLSKTNIPARSRPFPATRRVDIHPLDRAIAELRAELARTPDDSTLLGRLGALYYRRGSLKEAEHYYRQAIALSPRRPTLYNNLGNVLCDVGRMRDGIAAYEHAIALEKSADPTRGPSPEAIVNLELARLENRLMHERIDYLERAAQLDVSSAETVNALGCGYMLRAQRLQALQMFRRAAEMDPRSLPAALNIAFVHSLGLEDIDLKTVQAEIAEAILRFPSVGRLHMHQGELLENAGLLEGAEERYLRALIAEPRFIEAYDLLGRLREATGTVQTRDETAHAVEQTLKKLEQSAWERRTRDGAPAEAQALFDMALAQVARARFTRKPLTDPEAVDALLREVVPASIPATSTTAWGEPDVAVRAAVLRAQLFESDGRRDEARMVLENAAKAHGENARLWFERGALALRSGDVEQAMGNFDRATIVAPEDAVSYHSLRFAFEGYRRYRTEVVRFESSTKANPRDGMAHHHLALAALSVLRNEEALKHFARALEFDPRLSDAACGRGRALQRLGRLDEAEAAFSQALQIDPENAEAQRSLLAIRSQRLV
jgi:tetratricopeptide (TPR) repeat protein